MSPSWKLPAPRVLCAVGALGLSQIVGYGTLHYSFGPLAAAMAEDFALSSDRVFGAFSLAWLVGAVAPPLAGRLIDRYGAGRIMSFGSLGAAAGLSAAALAPHPLLFTLALVAMQLAAALVFYDAAFACLVQLYGREAPRRIAELTLIGGFASTLFWPLTQSLNESLDWRTIYLLFGGLHLLVCLPIHAWLARLLRETRVESGATARAEPQSSQGDPPSPLSEQPQRRLLLLVTLAFSLGGLLLSAITMHMVPLLAALGFGTAAAGLGALFGPAQVAVRLLQMGLGERLSPAAGALLATGLLAGSLLLLAVSAPSMAAGVLFALAFGFGSGLTSIVRGTLPLALFGRSGFAQRLGRITAVRLVSSAAAPFAFAFLAEHFGTGAALYALVAVGTAAVLSFAGVLRLARASGYHARPAQLVP